MSGRFLTETVKLSVYEKAAILAVARHVIHDGGSCADDAVALARMVAKMIFDAEVRSED